MYRLRTLARQHIDAQLQLHGKAAQEALREDMLMERPFQAMQDIDAMLPLVRRLAKRLVSRQRRRLKREDHGRPSGRGAAARRRPASPPVWWWRSAPPAGPPPCKA